MFSKAMSGESLVFPDVVDQGGLGAVAGVPVKRTGRWEVGEKDMVIA
jgi:hypothetical protein